MSLRIALVLACAAVVAACGSTETPPSPSPLRCDVAIAAFPADAPVPVMGGALPGDAEIIVAPPDVDWSASAIAPDDQGIPALTLQLRPGAAQRLADYTRDNIGSVIPMAINGRIVALPTIQSAIDGGQVQIMGGGPGTFDPLDFRACLAG